MPHCDSAFYIGKSHNICEDYATTFSSRNRQHVVLCDGCSSSHMVDVGARLLSLAFASLIDDDEGDIDNDTITHFARKFFADNYKMITSHPTMFDTTLLYVKEGGNKMVQAGVIGDGVIVYKHKNGQLIINDYQSGNMPRYLSYAWDAKREEIYNSCGIKFFFDHYIDGVATAHSIDTFHHNIMIGRDDIEWVAILSDGVHSFRDSKNTPIDFLTVIKAMTDFKFFAGQFAQRRLNGFRKECAKNGWTHDDDISIGCLYLGE